MAAANMGRREGMGSMATGYDLDRLTAGDMVARLDAIFARQGRSSR
jgi:hypothetical protein